MPPAENTSYTFLKNPLSMSVGKIFIFRLNILEKEKSEDK